jgi:hypothetical protein
MVLQFSLSGASKPVYASQGKGMGSRITMERFFGGSPAAIVFKLAVASIIIGVILSFLGFNPANLYDAIVRLGHWISSLGFDALETVFRYLVLGAIVVVPLWLLSRVFSMFGSGRQR